MMTLEFLSKVEGAIARARGYLQKEDRDTLAEAVRELKRLSYHENTTVGLWATDVPGKIVSAETAKELLFYIDKTELKET